MDEKIKVGDKVKVKPDYEDILIRDEILVVDKVYDNEEYHFSGYLCHYKNTLFRSTPISFRKNQIYKIKGDNKNE